MSDIQDQNKAFPGKLVTFEAPKLEKKVLKFNLLYRSEEFFEVLREMFRYSPGKFNRDYYLYDFSEFYQGNITSELNGVKISKPFSGCQELTSCCVSTSEKLNTYFDAGLKPISLAMFNSKLFSFRNVPLLNEISDALGDLQISLFRRLRNTIVAGLLHNDFYFPFMTLSINYQYVYNPGGKINFFDLLRKDLEKFNNDKKLNGEVNCRIQSLLSLLEDLNHSYYPKECLCYFSFPDTRDIFSLTAEPPEDLLDYYFLKERLTIQALFDIIKKWDMFDRSCRVENIVGGFLSNFRRHYGYVFKEREVYKLLIYSGEVFGNIVNIGNEYFFVDPFYSGVSDFIFISNIEEDYIEEEEYLINDKEIVQLRKICNLIKTIVSTIEDSVRYLISYSSIYGYFLLRRISATLMSRRSLQEMIDNLRELCSEFLSTDRVKVIFDKLERLWWKFEAAKYSGKDSGNNPVFDRMIVQENRELTEENWELRKQLQLIQTARNK